MSANPWLVGITNLRRAHGERRHQLRRGPVGPLRVADCTVPEGAEAVADVVLESVDGGIVVSGDVRAPWEGECRRCLAELDGELCVGVHEVFRPGAGDEDTYGVEGEELDLRPMVSDALMLALPVAPLCREDCAGLCTLCGANRNEEPCTCRADDIDPRWSGLLDDASLLDGPADLYASADLDGAADPDGAADLGGSGLIHGPNGPNGPDPFGGPTLP